MSSTTRRLVFLIYICKFNLIKIHFYLKLSLDVNYIFNNAAVTVCSALRNGSLEESQHFIIIHIFFALMAIFLIIIVLIIVLNSVVSFTLQRVSLKNNTTGEFDTFLEEGKLR